MSAVNQTLVKQRIISRMTQTPFKSKSKLFKKKKKTKGGRKVILAQRNNC
jgi:hypothetical protein